MSKVTNDGWPDPNVWAKQLHERLDEVGDQFVQTPWVPAEDPNECSGLNLKQVMAAKAIMEVCSALRELPPFEKSTGVATLHTIATAIDDVVNGGHPRLFQAAIPGSPGGDELRMRYLRGQVVLAVRYLVEGHGLSVNAASKFAAPIFAEAGATGRTGRPLSATTVKDWAERTHPLSENKQDRRIERDIEARMVELREHPDWPGTLDNARTWLSRLARDPLLTSKYGKPA